MKLNVWAGAVKTNKKIVSKIFEMKKWIYKLKAQNIAKIADFDSSNANSMNRLIKVISRSQSYSKLCGIKCKNFWKNAKTYE